MNNQEWTRIVKDFIIHWKTVSKWKENAISHFFPLFITPLLLDFYCFFTFFLFPFHLFL